MAASTNERELVLDILQEIIQKGEYSHIVLKNVLDQYQYLEKKERAFITRVVNGTLEHMIELDYIINQFSKVKVNKMKPIIRTIIRSGVYQLKYMDSVPDSAVCNEAVKLAQKRGFHNLKGFVNGVLRNIARNLDKVTYPDESNAVESISVRYSLPEWMVERWLHVYDRDIVEKMGQAFLEETPMSVRCNLSKIDREALKELLKQEGVTATEDEKLSCALYLQGIDYLAGLESFQKGYFQVQDISSMYVAQMVQPAQGDYVIDVCAAPGGKSLHVADILAGTGHVEARDLTPYKVAMIQENIERSGFQNMEAVCADAAVRDESSVEKADIVIADLPCSGLGVIGKKPDLKYKMKPEMMAELEQLQREILSVVCDYVKPEGKLVYSTCTINRGENEDNGRWFEKEHPEFKMIEERQMLPGIDGGDGFYIALFQKEKHE